MTSMASHSPTTTLSATHLRRANDRGLTQWDWLTSYHTFSFGDYIDPSWHHAGVLRVINDDIIAAGQGFGRHPHRDMEIVTLMLAGHLRHKDSMGNDIHLHAGDVQRMTTGTGIEHSEMNGSSSEAVHLLQIWVIPDERNLTPSYQQHWFEALADKPSQSGYLELVLPNKDTSAHADDDVIRIHQDAAFGLLAVVPNQPAELALAPQRQAWVHVIDGPITLTTDTGSVTLSPGDAVLLSNWTDAANTGVSSVTTATPARVLVIEMAYDGTAKRGVGRPER